MKRFLSLILVMTLTALMSAADELTVAPGTLAGTDGATLERMETLVLKGEIDGNDLFAIRDKCTSLRSLDLTAVRIAAGTAPREANGFAQQFDADALPAGALAGLGAAELRLPATLKTIGDHALAMTSAPQILLPENLESIGACAFAGSKIEKITLPKNLTSLGDYAFARCGALTEAAISSPAITALPTGTFMGCTALATLTTSAVTRLGDMALCGTSALTTFTHPTLTALGARALEGSGLKEIDAKWVKETGDYAMAFMPNLETLEISGYHTDYGQGALAGNTSLTGHTPDGEAPMPDMLYAATPGVDFSNTVINTRSVGKYALLGNKSKNLIVGENLAEVSDGALSGMTALTEIDATRRYNNPPATGDTAFEGIDQPKVILKVAQHTRPEWSNAQGWKGFDIQEVAGIVTSTGDNKAGTGITFRRSGSVLTVAADEPLRRVELIDTDGRILCAGTPGGNEYYFDLEGIDCQVLIIRAETASGARTAKLTR